MEQAAQRALRARPDRDREQHYVDGGEAGDAERLEQGAALRIDGVACLAAEGLGGEAQLRDGGLQAFDIEAGIMGDADPAGGEVDPGGMDAGDAGKTVFQLGDAAGAEQALDGEEAGAGFGADQCRGAGVHAGTSCWKPACVPSASTMMRTR